MGNEDWTRFLLLQDGVFRSESPMGIKQPNTLGESARPAHWPREMLMGCEEGVRGA